MLDLRTAATRRDTILSDRLDRLIQPLMERAGLDAWVIAAREYNEDPVLQTMLPATWLETARRRTIVMFLRESTGVRRFSVSRYAVGDHFPQAWEPDAQPDQWARVAELLEDADPGRIGIHRSEFPLADGLSSSEFDELSAALPGHLRSRLVSAEAAAIGWLETRLPEEVDILAEACALSHRYLGRALSGEGIVPAETTTEDVEWWLRSAVASDGLTAWFHPTTSVQRHETGTRTSFAYRPQSRVIMPGDLVHIDFGITLDGYCTDQQQHAYVLLDGETAAPAGLTAGLRAANRLQDALFGAFATGRTGNQVLAAARSTAAAEGIDGLIYTHPIGLHGHAAGPTIGLWDQQDGVAGQGDYPVWPDTAYSIELQARVPVAEWDGQVVAFMLEEDAFFDGESVTWLDSRQTDLHLI